MLIKSTGRIEEIHRGKNGTYEMSVKVLSHYGLLHKYTDFHTKPYYLDENNKICFLHEGDVIGKGIDVLSGYGYCPECEEVLVKPDSSNKTFCECSNKNCNFAIPKEIRGYELTKKNVTDLILYHRTNLITAFKHRGVGTPFKGYLFLDENNLVQLKRL